MFRDGWQSLFELVRLGEIARRYRSVFPRDADGTFTASANGSFHLTLQLFIGLGLHWASPGCTAIIHLDTLQFKRIDHRTVIITGASRGIGAGLVGAFLKQG